MAKPKCLVCGGPMDKGHRQAVLDEVVRLRDAERRLVELQEAVRWERECGSSDVVNAMSKNLPYLWRKHGLDYVDAVQDWLAEINKASRAAVDALVGEQ